MKEKQVGARQVDLEGIPEPIARAIELMAQTARKLTDSGAEEHRRRAQLPVWDLGISGVVRREDYYDDAL